MPLTVSEQTLRILLTPNFITLMILFGLVMIMFANRDYKLPASNLVKAGIILLLIVTFEDMFRIWSSAQTEHLAVIAKIRQNADTVSYILRPVIILLEVLIIAPMKKYRLICALPAIINGVIYATVFFGNHAVFYIDEQNRFHSDGSLRHSIYFAQIIYVVLLAVFTVSYFRRQNKRRGFIILAIVVQSVIVSMLEFTNILSGYVNAVTALGITEYYTYLVLIYQQEMRETLAGQERDLAQKTLTILKNQMQPHFIFNSLSIIRSLAKRDSEKAVLCIDTFSEYLRAHIGALRTDDLIPFEKELENVKLYLSLVHADYTREMEVIYDFAVTDFLLPPLSLEPIVENAIHHGISRRGGKIVIRTYEEEGCIRLLVADNGTAASEQSGADTHFHNGVGLKNTGRRIEMQCGGALQMETTDHGTTVSIVLPKNRPAGDKKGRTEA